MTPGFNVCHVSAYNPENYSVSSGGCRPKPPRIVLFFIDIAHPPHYSLCIRCGGVFEINGNTRNSKGLFCLFSMKLLVKSAQLHFKIITFTDDKNLPLLRLFFLGRLSPSLSAWRSFRDHHVQYPPPYAQSQAVMTIKTALKRIHVDTLVFVYDCSARA